MELFIAIKGTGRQARRYSERVCRSAMGWAGQGSDSSSLKLPTRSIQVKCRMLSAERCIECSSDSLPHHSTTDISTTYQVLHKTCTFNQFVRRFKTSRTTDTRDMYKVSHNKPHRIKFRRLTCLSGVPKDIVSHRHFVCLPFVTTIARL